MPRRQEIPQLGHAVNVEEKRGGVDRIALIGVGRPRVGANVFFVAALQDEVVGTHRHVGGRHLAQRQDAELADFKQERLDRRRVARVRAAFGLENFAMLQRERRCQFALFNHDFDGAVGHGEICTSSITPMSRTVP